MIIEEIGKKLAKGISITVIEETLLPTKSKKYKITFKDGDVFTSKEYFVGKKTGEIDLFLAPFYQHLQQEARRNSKPIVCEYCKRHGNL
jgi:hypothetical protein